MGGVRRRWQDEGGVRVRGRLLDKRRWRKKSRRQRSRESRRHGLTSLCDGSADCDGGDANDGGREELRDGLRARRRRWPQNIPCFRP